eukprot:4497459-Pleurochrysis_carterae.AAC.2
MLRRHQCLSPLPDVTPCAAMYMCAYLRGPACPCGRAWLPVCRHARDARQDRRRDPGGDQRR